MTQQDNASLPPTLDTALRDHPQLARLTGLVLGAWPEHADYLAKSYDARTPALMATSEAMAGAVLRLAGDKAPGVAGDYRWLCDQIREEEIHFARTDSYRFTQFKDTLRHVYSDDAFMERYMHGLLYSHVLWYMHASSLHFFRERLAARVKPGGRVMEIGSGHGLLLYLALTELGMSQAVAWDISPVSLEQTREALELLGTGDRARYAIQDANHIEAGGETFDLVLLSHLLEHLDDPEAILKRVRHAVNKGGYLFVNVPLNAPMPDHLQLYRDPREVLDLLERGGFRVVEYAAHTTQATTLPRALKRKIAVTCSVIAEPA